MGEPQIGDAKLVHDASGAPRFLRFVACQREDIQCDNRFWAEESWLRAVEQPLCDDCHEGVCDGRASYRREEHDE